MFNIFGKKVVTRFAPSPTGFMHVGGVRTAIYAWTYARQNGGKFILRIEDTDKEREVVGSVDHIIESLRWLGIEWDEGPILQSGRLDSYKKYAHILIDKGFAYADPYTEAEVEEFRKQAEAEKRPFLYRDHRPTNPPAWDGTKPLRFKVPTVKRYEWDDIVRGKLSAGEEALDDFILIKSDGYPTYNFAHIVDDLEMGVTHILRGEEFISSTPRFLSLYDALGVERPAIATMPVILGSTGTKKLSKRDGAKDVLDYRKEGYLPEAILNYLALLGWHPEDDTEVMSAAEMQKIFTLERLQKGGARFDDAKLLWINAEHLKRLSNEEYDKHLEEFQGSSVDSRLVPLIKERAKTLAEAQQLVGEYDFINTVSVTSDLLTQHGKIAAPDASRHLQAARDLLTNCDDFTAEGVKAALWPYAEAQGRGAVLWPLRTALSGREKSPDPFTIAALVGKQTTLERIERASQML